MSRSESELTADVCVVGAGAGGAVAAAELAEGGARVVLLEQGPHHDPDHFSARPAQMMASLYRDGGQGMTIGSPPILLPLGSGIGGTTLVNSGTCFRTPEPVLERWRQEFGLKELTSEELERCFARVERALSVAEVDPRLAGANAAVARRGAERLGWSHGYLHRNARGCVGSGVCAFGCPTSAKQHTGITYIPRAKAAGAQIITGARVTLITTKRARHQSVSVRLQDHTRLRVRSEHLVLAAGTIHTPLLLDHSGLAGRSGQLGANLSLHPATAAFALMDEVVDMARGVPQSLYIDQFADRGIMLEGVAGPPTYAAMALPLQGSEHARAMANYRRLAQFGLMVSDSSRGHVRSLGGKALIRYDMDRSDVRRFREGLSHLRELFDAAGALEIYLPLAPGIIPERARRRDLKLLGFHPLGSARAHADPEHGVVDANLALHDTHGIHLADGSVVPSSLGVNPQITIMALATRLAFTLLGTRVPDTAASETTPSTTTTAEM